MAGETKQTTDRQTIMDWAEQRDGSPATVSDTTDDGPGVLRLDFPGYSGDETLERISWDDFFEKFEQKNLLMLYQEETADGETSRFFKFVDRDQADS